MTIKDRLNWADVPEFVLDTSWRIKIEDGLAPTPVHNNYMTELMLDYSIAEITFPQEELDFEKTSFGLPILKGIGEYSTVSIKYYDYVNTPMKIKYPMTKFFQDWMNTLYDKNRRCVQKDWRKHYKNIDATLTKYFKKGPASSFASNIANEGIAIANTYANPLGFNTGVNIPKTVFDSEEVIVANYRIQNCYVTKLNEITLEETSGDRKEFTVDLICERVDLTEEKEGEEQKFPYSLLSLNR